MLNFLLTRSHIATLLVLTASPLCTACSFGPLPATTGSAALTTGTIGVTTIEDMELQAASCEGIALERKERLSRIDNLKASIASELAMPPATLMQAVKRASSNPEAGTAAYDAIGIEETRLQQLAAATASKACPAGTVVNSR